MGKKLIFTLRLQGPGFTREVTLKKGMNYLGREPGNDIQIALPKVSRRHASFECLEAVCILQDLGSANGTLVDGMRIQPNVPTSISDNNLIEIDVVHIMLRTDVADVPEQAAEKQIPDTVSRAVPARRPTEIPIEKKETRPEETVPKPEEAPSPQAEAVQKEIPVEEPAPVETPHRTAIPEKMVVQAVENVAEEAQTPVIEAAPEEHEIPEAKAAVEEAEAPAAEAVPEEAKILVAESVPEEVETTTAEPAPEEVKAPIIESKPGEAKALAVEAAPEELETPVVEAVPGEEAPPVETEPQAVETPAKKRFMKEPAGPPTVPPSEPPHKPAVPQASAPGEPEKEWIIPPGLSIDSIRLLDYLPGIYHTGFMSHFMALFESILLPVEWNIENFDLFLSPKTAPEEFLPWLGSWYDIFFDASWSEEKRRVLLSEAHEIYACRGTRRALSRLLEIYTGEKPVILEFEKDMDPHTFRVLIKGNSLPDKSLLIRMIDANKPAHTSYKLEIMK